MSYQVVGTKIFNDKDQELLVQVDKYVFKLKYFKNIDTLSDVKNLLDDKRFDVRFLEDEV